MLLPLDVFNKFSSLKVELFPRPQPHPSSLSMQLIESPFILAIISPLLFIILNVLLQLLLLLLLVSYGLWQLRHLLFLKKQELFNIQSNNAAKNASIPKMIAITISVVLESITATNNVIEKNRNPTSIGQHTNLFKNIATTIVANANAKNISIVIINISFYVFAIFYDDTYNFVTHTLLLLNIIH